jgi:hypothetical protein
MGWGGRKRESVCVCGRGHNEGMERVYVRGTADTHREKGREREKETDVSVRISEDRERKGERERGERGGERRRRRRTCSKISST